MTPEDAAALVKRMGDHMKAAQEKIRAAADLAVQELQAEERKFLDMLEGKAQASPPGPG